MPYTSEWEKHTDSFLSLLEHDEDANVALEIQEEKIPDTKSEESENQNFTILDEDDPQNQLFPLDYHFWLVLINF